MRGEPGVPGSVSGPRLPGPGVTGYDAWGSNAGGAGEARP